MLLLAIAVAAFVSTLAGGLLALGLRDKLHLILGFSAGAVIGVAFFDLLPEAIDSAREFHSAATILAWSALGFLALSRARPDAAHSRRCARRAASAGALVLCAHSLLDGVAIGFAFQGSHAVGLIVADRRAHARFLGRRQHHEHRAAQRRRAGARLALAARRCGGAGRRHCRDSAVDAADGSLRRRARAVRRLLSLHRRERSDSRELPCASEAPHHR